MGLNCKRQQLNKFCNVVFSLGIILLHFYLYVCVYTLISICVSLPEFNFSGINRSKEHDLRSLLFNMVIISI